MKRPTVGELLDDPVFGARLQSEIERSEYEADLRLLALYQESSARGGAAVPKTLWRRIVRYRREHA